MSVGAGEACVLEMRRTDTSAMRQKRTLAPDRTADLQQPGRIAENVSNG
jgi:hypothetical protein